MRKGVFGTIMSAKAVNGVGTSINVDQYDSVVLTIIGYDTPTGTIKTFGTAQATEPDFSAPASETNIYTPKYSNDEDSGSGVQGSTGIAYTGANKIYEVQVNTNNLRWLNCQLSGFAAGKFTVLARGIRRTR